MKTSQAWSMDIMIAIVLFIGTIFVFYSVLSAKQSPKTDELQDDASIVLESIVSEDSDIGILDGAEVNETKLEELLGMEYSEIKKKMRVENEFCIFLEDEEGNVIYITQDQPGIGSDEISVSEVPCG
jgi:hypothetical protein|tara:strand:- start:1827 stop:2207 length:381 start_codon:yes stop_codon:yes gene_type:complete